MPTKVKCSFRKITEHPCLANYKPDRLKSGRYLQSYFWGTIEDDFKYVAAGYVDIANYKYLRYKRKMSDEDIVDACFDYFNSFTTKKRKTKKLKYKYGHLKMTSFEKKNGSFLVKFLTTDKKNANFWGKGLVYQSLWRVKKG